MISTRSIIIHINSCSALLYDVKSQFEAGVVSLLPEALPLVQD